MQYWLGEMDTGFWYLVKNICMYLNNRVDTKLNYMIDTELNFFQQFCFILDDGLPISK